MTVVSSVISKYCTAHASDSLITRILDDGTREPIEWEKSKIIPVPKWRGAFAFWGLAIYEAQGWSTHNWLQAKASGAGNYGSAESFAQAVTEELNEEIYGMSFTKSTDAGLGIHFSAY